MRLIRGPIIALLLVVLSGVCTGHHAHATAHKRFGNMTYMTDAPYIVEKVTLLNGSRETRIDRLYHHLSYEGRYIYGDFNHDALQDAAVILSQGESGSGDFRSLAFLINDGTQLIHRQSAGLGDRAVIRSLRERDGKVFIDMFIHQSGDCMAGPTKHVQYVYAYTGQGQWAEGTLVNILPSRRLRAS